MSEKQLVGHKYARQSLRRCIGLSLDFLISVIGPGGNLGSRARGMHLEGVFFVNAFGLSFDKKTIFAGFVNHNYEF